MKLKDKLLKSARIGRRVTIVLNEIRFTGKIISISTETIQLDTGQYQPEIGLSGIVAFFFEE